VELRKIRVMVLGLRGVVGVQGGIETHARMLYPLLVRLGCDVEIVQRTPYFPRGARPTTWHGVRLSYIWSPTRRALETGIHSLLGVLYAAIRRPDVLHLHAIGPGLLAPLARLLGLKVVLTYHTPEYERDKFSRFEKWLLRWGETLGMRFANRSIAVSRAQAAYLERRFNTKVAFVPNGAPRTVPAVSTRTLDLFGLRPGRYVLCVGRLDPVKRHSDLIEAFGRIDARDWKLVIVGGFPEHDPYGTRIASQCGTNPSIVMTGFQNGRALRELYSHAGLFVLPSSMEGHPIALLEALSYGIPTISTAIPANLEMPITRNRYFAVGDVRRLASKIAACIDRPDRYRSQGLRQRILRDFSWRNAAEHTRLIYEHVAAGDGIANESLASTESWPKLS
jgi:glycosyltransferase involved in cell wall biosynthesis